ncbi:hypothetical protein sos41_31070 [Alphaproteobacteria bacterium SO-S41]|nr:hypothetical protein sos41_31070 [Alphaproteobacteria bacterium SO-S41]
MTGTASWDAALRHAARAFGLMPERFWRLSVREWRALNAGAVTALGVAEMAALMRAFPDRRRTYPSSSS